MNARRTITGRLVLIAAALALAGAVALQMISLARPVPPLLPPHLARNIAADLPGWASRDLPLGPSEFLSSEVEKVLNYDEVINREYQRGSDRFGVYVAYWSAGKMPVQLVASHTPDRCWTENGWRCLDMRFKQRGFFAGMDVAPAEWRLFEPPLGGAPTYVLYWHLVDGETYDYGERFNAVPDPVRWWRGAMKQAFKGQGEQYFIRLTSDQPWENLWADPGFREIVLGLGRLGLGGVPVEPRKT